MITHLIFDLSEVLIRGLVGVEKELSKTLPEMEETILKVLGGKSLELLCLGKISEIKYLDEVIKLAEWNISRQELRQIIRKNFHHTIPNMTVLLKELGKKYKLILLTDHCKEWIEYILKIHPFLNIFQSKFYSYKINSLKTDKETFRKLLEKLSVSSENCLFIDDNPANVKCAEYNGIKGITFINSDQLYKEIKLQKNNLTNNVVIPSL